MSKLAFIGGLCAAIGIWGCWVSVAIGMWIEGDYWFAIPFTVAIIGALCLAIAAVLA